MIKIQPRLSRSVGKTPAIIRRLTATMKWDAAFNMIKPEDYNKFMEAVENPGAFVSMEELRVPTIKG